MDPFPVVSFRERLAYPIITDRRQLSININQRDSPSLPTGDARFLKKLLEGPMVVITRPLAALASTSPPHLNPTRAPKPAAYPSKADMDAKPTQGVRQREGIAVSPV